MISTMKKNSTIKLGILIIVILSIIFYIIYPILSPINFPLDVDYIDSGKFSDCYLVSNVNEPVRIIDKMGTIKWETDLNGFFVHDCDILPNGNVLIADTSNNRVIEVDINDPSKIVWSWDASNINDINWTRFFKENGFGNVELPPQNLYYAKAWTHLNDVDFISGISRGVDYDSILISLSWFNMIVEVNYSSQKEIVWWYGHPNKPEIINHQHNPDLLKNGNMIICDSGNNRIIEINSNTKEIIWELKFQFPRGTFRTPRDCDYIGKGRYLITDSFNNRILIYSRNTNQIVKEIRSPLFINPYEADLLKDNKTIMIGGAMNNCIMFFDLNTGMLKHIIGFNNYFAVFYAIILFVLAYYIYQLFFLIKRSKNEKWVLIKYHEFFSTLFYCFICLLTLYYFNYWVIFLWRIIILG